MIVRSIGVLHTKRAFNRRSSSTPRGFWVYCRSTETLVCTRPVWGLWRPNLPWFQTNPCGV